MYNNKKPIPHRVYNPSKEHPYVTGAVDIYDDAKGENQQSINAETDETLALHQSEINALDSQNYVTVTADDQTTAATDVLPEEGQKGTVYRVGNWDGTQYDPTVYSEYGWDAVNETYKLLDVKEYTLATAADFINPDATKKAKIPTVGAVSEMFGSYENAPEYLYAQTDANKKIVFFIRNDGSVDWPIGVPGPIEEYIKQYIVEENIHGLVQVTIDSKEMVVSEISETGEKTEYLPTAFRQGVKLEKSVNLTNESANSLSKNMDGKITSINALNPHSYYYPKIVNLNMPKKGTSLKPFVLCHFSDIHGSENYSRVMEFISYYKQRHLCEDIILTGDMVSAVIDDSIDFMSTEGDDKCLLVIGNHDAWKTNTPPIVEATQKECYDRFFAPWIDGWDVVQPENAASQGKCYYYKDYPNSKLRMIVTDCMHDSEDQAQFVEDSLSDAIQEDYSVIMVQHYPAKEIISIDSPFQSIDFTGEVLEQNHVYVEKVESFMNNGGKFICWVTGHTHADTFGYLNGYQNQLQIGIECAANARTQDTERPAGTRMQDCFNIYSIDTYMGILTILRVGANTDRHGRIKDMFVWDYINKREII